MWNVNCVHAQFPRVLHMGDKRSPTEFFPQPSCEHFVFITFPITVKKIPRGKYLKGGKIYSGSVIGWGHSMTAGKARLLSMGYLSVSQEAER